MKKSKLYTKTGDKGKTSLVGGQRVAKSCSRLESYGTIDELNAFVGLLMAECHDDPDIETLRFIQHQLFTIGAYLATDHSEPLPFEMPLPITAPTIRRLENEIDRLDATLPEMKAFILPSGGRAAASAHICRTVARRAERRIYALEEEGIEVDRDVLAFINRLSDYFFILARSEAHKECGQEIIWDQSCK